MTSTITSPAASAWRTAAIVSMSSATSSRRAAPRALASSCSHRRRSARVIRSSVTDDLRAGLWDPTDGDIDPAQLTQALAKGARDAGAQIYRRTRVTALTGSRTAAGVSQTSARSHRCRVRHQRRRLSRRRNRAAGGRVPADRHALTPVPGHRRTFRSWSRAAMRGCRWCAIRMSATTCARSARACSSVPTSAQPKRTGSMASPRSLPTSCSSDDLGRARALHRGGLPPVPILGSVGVKTRHQRPDPLRAGRQSAHGSGARGCAISFTAARSPSASCRPAAPAG